MNRVTQISAWLAIWLFIASAPAIFPGALAAAQSGETPGIMQQSSTTVDLRAGYLEGI